MRWPWRRPAVVVAQLLLGGPEGNLIAEILSDGRIVIVCDMPHLFDVGSLTLVARPDLNPYA